MGTRLFVGGLSSRVREEDLEDFFDGFGRIRDIVIKGNKIKLVHAFFHFRRNKTRQAVRLNVV